MPVAGWPGALAPLQLHWGHPGSPSPAALLGSMGGPVAPGGTQPGWRNWGGSSRAWAPSQQPPPQTGKPLGPVPCRSGFNWRDRGGRWAAGGEAGLGWQCLARAGEALVGRVGGRRAGRGLVWGPQVLGCPAKPLRGLSPSRWGPRGALVPRSAGGAAWFGSCHLPAAALGALASAARGPFPTRPAQGWPWPPARHRLPWDPPNSVP